MAAAKQAAQTVRHSSDGGGAVYFFGLIGAFVYYVHLAQGFWGVIAAVLKSLVWPAYLVYELFKYVD